MSRAGCQEIHVSVIADGTESFAPSSKPLQAEVLDNETDEKLSNVRKVPLTCHVGKSGVGKCFGGAFTKAFISLFKAVKDLRIELRAERAEARDREQPLKTKIDFMQGQLKACNSKLLECRESLKKVDGELAVVRSGKHLFGDVNHEKSTCKSSKDGRKNWKSEREVSVEGEATPKYLANKMTKKNRVGRMLLLNARRVSSSPPSTDDEHDHDKAPTHL